MFGLYFFDGDVSIVPLSFRAGRPSDAAGDDFRNLRTADEIRLIMAERAVEDTSFSIMAFPDDGHDRPVDPWADMTVKCRRDDFNRKMAQKSHREVCKALFPYYIKVCGEVITTSPEPFEHDEKRWDSEAEKSLQLLKRKSYLEEIQ